LAQIGPAFAQALLQDVDVKLGLYAAAIRATPIDRLFSRLLRLRTPYGQALKSFARAVVLAHRFGAKRQRSSATSTRCMINVSRSSERKAARSRADAELVGRRLPSRATIPGRRNRAAISEMGKPYTSLTDASRRPIGRTTGALRVHKC